LLILLMNVLILITDIFGGISLFFNLLLLLLIFYHLPSHLGSFGINYYGMTIVDVLFALAQLIAAPCFFSDGEAYLIFSSRHWGAVPIIFFLLMHNTSFISISFNFVCRYVIVCKLEMNFESDFVLGNAIEILCGIGMFSYIRGHSSSRKLRSINYRLLIILTTQATMSAVFVYTPGLITALFTIAHIDVSFLSQVFRNSFHSINRHPSNQRI
ncbi:hypothetical protein PENTCL1PPCAC_4915, partial [Pristionchus entomophagus]